MRRNLKKVHGSCAPAVLICLAGLVQPVAAQLQPAGESLGLRQALDQSVRHNALLDAAESRTTAAAGLRQQAGLKQNPRLTVVNESLRAWEFSTPFRFAHSTDTTAYIAQTVERAAKIKGRVDYAATTEQRTRTETELVAVQIRARVASAYWAAATAARVVELYREDVAAFGQIVEYNRQRVREGAAAGADLLRVEIERDRLVATGRRAEQDAEAARIALLREMGRGDYPALRFTDALEDLPVPGVVLPEEALRERSEIRVAEAVVRQQEKNAALQRANALVDPEWSAGYKRTVGLDGLYLGVTIPLSFRNRNQGNIAAADAELNANRSLLRALSLQLRAELEAAQRDYSGKRSALEQTIVPLRMRTREAERIALAAYREGGVELLRFLDAERTRIETEVLYFRALAEVQQSVVSLKLAQGKEL